MSSILTNNSAMVALQTLRGINKGLAQTQTEISTGKTVGSARDNAAVWSISKTMESDVKGFKAISDSLSLGSSTIGVARQASETVTDLLTQMKGLIVAAQEENVDRGKIQTDIAALSEQVESVVNAAQFNGLNLLTNNATVSVLSSLDRSSTGVSTSTIDVVGQDMSTGGYTAKAAFSLTTGTASANQDRAAFSLDGGGGTETLTIEDPTYEAGDKISLRIGDQTVSYTVSQADVDATTTADIVAVGLKNAIDSLGIDGLEVDYDSGNAGELVFTNNGTDDVSVTAQFKNAGSGDLATLSTIDVETDAAGALATIESLIETSIDAAASFGSAQMRIDTQAEFVSNLTDSLTSGIGSLVDADMEATSARLQALQVQQQLATQSLSIANQQPQNILSLFR
ncbi:flagellin [Roseibaca sp. Y0-43]|uniref:flagellin N-terminal helical domain-containing protein n=1 Tax=Roseibaca sp. Y0-43 TaxID=2816854 RepID=UPI001D0CDB08|nr:flagellin [Roseibaca sp. Y0-43]MCC1481299.1 flagellin [Roseibaca sp. Y0-43]